MCLSCSRWWYCTDSELTTEEECPNPIYENCKDGQCECTCHLRFSADPAKSVPYKHSNYTTYLSPKERQWALENFKCTRHVFQYVSEMDEHQKYTGKHHYENCQYCDTKVITCPECGFCIFNNIPGELKTECTTIECANNPHKLKWFK